MNNHTKDNEEYMKILESTFLVLILLERYAIL